MPAVKPAAVLKLHLTLYCSSGQKTRGKKAANVADQGWNCEACAHTHTNLVKCTEQMLAVCANKVTFQSNFIHENMFLEAFVFKETTLG